MSSLKTKNLKSRRFGRDPDFASGLKTKPMALIFSGYGLNTEDETKTAFEMAGGHAEIVHINDLLSRPAILKSAQIVVFPGGFSYGDDTGSGKAYGNRIKEHLGEALQKFLSRGTLLAGICNGFQIITNAGILPGALLPNDNARYTCRWVDLIVKNESPWLSGISKISLPIAHGEGKYYAPEATLTKLEEEEKIGLVYERGARSCRIGRICASDICEVEDRFQRKVRVSKFLKMQSGILANEKWNTLGRAKISTPRRSAAGYLGV
ncbi:MAG: Phosphoribosylformylglycinamidine synthase 1 [Parcubacteria group bacterium GW2011_GWA2_51_10]|nr:MAG: Phosphoribosylformylglycinamidine synthase 1 [Parcubacteria group bacterium GW2011_GWA2_51_10]